MTQKNTWLVAVASVLLISQPCACSSLPESLPSPPPTVLPTAAPSPTTVSIEALNATDCEIHLWHSLIGKKEATLLSLAGDFARDNPYGIQMRVEFHGRLHDEVLAAIAAGTPPDLVIAQCGQITEYALAEAVVPLDEYVQSARYGLSKLEQGDLWPLVVEGGCLPANADHSLGLLFDGHVVVMFYNAQWLERLGAEAPPQTWEEFRQLCNAARERKAGTWGYASAVDGSTLANWILGLGGLLIDPNTGQPLLDSAEAVAALSVLKDLMQDECAYCVSEPGTDLADFTSEKVLFRFGTTDELPRLVEAVAGADELGFDWNIAPVPHLTDKPLVIVQGSTISILRSMPRQQLAAWLFVKWLLRPANDAQWVLASGALPMLKSTKYMPEMEVYLEQSPQYGTACDLRAYAQPEPAVPRWNDILALLTDAGATVCLEQTDPAEALAAADTAADDLLAR